MRLLPNQPPSQPLSMLTLMIFHIYFLPFHQQCNNCFKLLLHPHQRLNFFSDYSHSVTCPYCQSNDTHFIKQLNYCYTNKPLQQFQQWPWHEATLDSPKSSASPKIGSSNESGYLSLTNGESNVMGSKSSSIWGDKSLWNLSNSPNSTSSMQTANGSTCSSDGKDSFWQSTQSSPILSSSQYGNLNTLWGCSPIKNDHHEESLGSIWNIPTTSSPISKTPEGNLEAPLPPPISYNQKTQPQLLRPQDIGGSAWNGVPNNSDGGGGNMGCNVGNNNKVKDSVGSLWAHPTPPNLPLTLQAQNYSLASTNNKFQSSSIKPMGVAPSNGLLNGCNSNFSNQQAGMQHQQQQQQQQQQQLTQQGSTSCNNMQLFSDEFLNYLNMIN